MNRAPGRDGGGRTALAGIDVGTTHTKAGVYRPDGTVVAQRQAETPGDATRLADTALRLLADCVTAAATVPAAVGVAGMAETGVALDAAGTPVGELLDWRDRRAHRQAADLAETVGRDAFFTATGLHPSAKLPLARWLWLRRHDPDVLRRMARWAGAPDLVVAGLTGSVATSPTLAARTGAFGVDAGHYLPELLDLAELRADQMAPVVPAGDVAGRVGRAAAARTGIPAGTPVVAAGHDHLAAAWAAGVRAPGHVADSMGTAEALVVPVRSAPPRSARQTGISTGPYVDGRHRCLVSGLSASGGLVDWLLRRIAPPGRGDPRRRYAWFDELVGPPERPPTGITVQPYLNGRASPRPDPERRLSFHGIRPEHTLDDIGRAVLEGLCMQVRWMLETLTAISGRRPAAPAAIPATVTVFGGPAANPTWMWIKAQVMPAPVVLAGHRPWYAALGAAQLAGRAIGVDAPPPADPDRSPPATPATPPAAEWEHAYRSVFLPLATADDTTTPHREASP